MEGPLYITFDPPKWAYEGEVIFEVANYRALLTIRKGKILNKLICSTNEVQLNDFFTLAGGVNGLIKFLATLYTIAY